MDNSFEKPPIEEPGKLPEEEKKEELKDEYNADDTEKQGILQEQLGEKVSATASEKRILDIKTENAFTIPIIKEGKQVGASTIENLPEGWRIKWIDVEGARTTPTARGAGREAMRLLNQEATKEGKVLISDLEGKNQPDMIKAWTKLVESGEAEQLPDGSWAFKKAA